MPEARRLQLLDVLARCNFPPPGTAVVAAVSGGADSSALLVLAVEAGCDVTAIHVDHGLRLSSAGEADVVAALAERFGARFAARTAPVSPGPNLEARARHARHAVLGEGAMTGHTADDQAETVVLNLLRGAGLDGLAGMRPGVTKPLLDLRRRETMSLCRSWGITPLHDPSNDDRRFRRNQVRHEVVPLLDTVAQRDVAGVLARSARLWGEDADLLEQLAASLDPRDGRALAAAEAPLARRAVRRWLAGDRPPYPPDAATVERVLEVARGRWRATEVGGGRRMVRRHGRLRLEHDPGHER
ncbi:tRNA lysidine(34) synthetase TilS [soil metagenome]